MSRSSVSSRFLKSIAIIMLLAGLTTAQALTSAGPKRPAAVPANYVITPFGYFDPSCVSHLAKGDVLRQDEKLIQRANGNSESIHVCAYPHYRADGEKVIGDERAVREPNISHAWVEYASITTGAAFGQIYSEWDVPPAPTNNDGQTVYLFNGLEDINDVVTIIQPVLGWNSDYASAWGIASWNCCENGTVVEANLMMDRATGRPRGFGFVTMGSDAEAAAAVEALNGKSVGGRALTVNIARPREERSGGGGGGGGYRGGGGGGGGGGRREYRG